MCTLAVSTVRVKNCPTFVPNEYLFNTRPDVPKWEVYADAVREVIIQQTGFKPVDVTFADVKEYTALMQD